MYGGIRSYFMGFDLSWEKQGGELKWRKGKAESGEALGYPVGKSESQDFILDGGVPVVLV